jgi:hypothetical protein
LKKYIEIKVLGKLSPVSGGDTLLLNMTHFLAMVVLFCSGSGYSNVRRA